MEVAMKVAGHKTDSVDRRYAIVSDTDMRDAAARVGTLAANGRNGVGEVRDRIAQSR